MCFNAGQRSVLGKNTTRRKKKRTRKGTRKKKAQKKPRHGSKHKKSEKKTKPERKGRKKTSKLTKAEKRLHALQEDGIIILIDQPNIERGKAHQMQRNKERENTDKERMAIKYDELIKIVASGGSHSKPRNVLKTFMVTSKDAQIAAGCQPSKKFLKRNNIEYLVSPVRKTKPKDEEKAVDCMLVRKMVEEYAAIEVLRLQGKKAPKRTFCVLSADSDYVDVVRDAREKGYDVELWYFHSTKSFSPEKWKHAQGCDSGTCGKFVRKDLDRHTNKITMWREKNEHGGAWSAVTRVNQEGITSAISESHRSMKRNTFSTTYNL